MQYDEAILEKLNDPDYLPYPTTETSKGIARLRSGKDYYFGEHGSLESEQLHAAWREISAVTGSHPETKAVRAILASRPEPAAQPDAKGPMDAEGDPKATWWLSDPVIKLSTTLIASIAFVLGASIWGESGQAEVDNIALSEGEKIAVRSLRKTDEKIENAIAEDERMERMGEVLSSFNNLQGSDKASVLHNPPHRPHRLGQSVKQSLDQIVSDATGEAIPKSRGPN